MGSSGKDAVRDAQRASKKQLKAYQEQQKITKAAVEKQKQAYKDIEITNPYADMENRFANMDNAYEDLTVNQQQAQFEAQQGEQQRANIMQGLQGAAGGSGVAGLAQSMANQGQLQSQQISASIGQQETMNQKLAAQGAMAVQTAERTGAAGVDAAVMGGEAAVQQAVTGREATLLGMEYGELAGAQAGTQAAYGNVASANAMELERVNANKAAWASVAGAVVGGVATVATAGMNQVVGAGIKAAG